MLFGVLEFVEKIRRVQQGFGWNASTQEAGSAKVLIFLDDCRFQAQLTRSDCGNISARSGSNYGDVKRIVVCTQLDEPLPRLFFF